MEQTEDKYYTPGIEEFHVGFEYQFACEATIAGVSQPDFWVESIVESPSGLIDIMERAEVIKDCYRVKYLDKEDIESLGWVCSKSMSNDLAAGFTFTIEHTKRNNEYFDLAGNILSFPDWGLYLLGNNKILIKDTDALVVYHGECKNISKLRTILKDIGI
jgi:hypothetical protein